MEKKLPIKSINIEGGTQPREHLDQAWVDELAESIKTLPPPVVFFDGSEYWLADGFHRYWAHIKVSATSIECNVRKGTQRDAILYSVGANPDHGLKRSSVDKRRAVETLLDDAEWGKRSVKWIAETCRVSHSFADAIKKERNPSPAPVTGRDGKSYTAPTQKPATEPKQAPAREPDELKNRPHDAENAADIFDEPIPPPAVQGPPWAEFIAEVDKLLSETRALSRRYGDVFKADADTKQLREKYAYFISHSGTIGTLNGIIRFVQNNLPAAACQKSPGFERVAVVNAKKSLGGI